MIAAMIKPISRNFLINRPTMKPMTRGKSTATMKVVERSGGRIATKGGHLVPMPYEDIHEDATELRALGHYVAASGKTLDILYHPKDVEPLLVVVANPAAGQVNVAYWDQTISVHVNPNSGFEWSGLMLAVGAVLLVAGLVEGELGEPPETRGFCGELTVRSFIDQPIPRQESVVASFKRFIRMSAASGCCGIGTR